MKRTLITILAVFYLGVSSGATMHFHYCMGELVKWGFSKSEKPSCKFCKPPKKTCNKSCCKDDQKQAKVDVTNKTVSAYQFEQFTAVQQPEISWESVYLPIPIEIGKAALGNAPPPIQNVPIFARNCTYII